jgi:Arc-like DNA binding domain
MDQPKVHIHMVMRQDEHEQVKQAAEASCRSVQKEILFRLRRSFRRAGRQAADRRPNTALDAADKRDRSN